MKLKTNFAVALLLLVILAGCTFYTFKDGAYRYDTLQKIRIQQFENNAGNGPPDLTVTLTEKTKDFYLQNGKFELVDINEDLRLESEITGYRVDYSGATAGEQAQQYKLSITVAINFTDINKDTTIAQSFTRYEQFDASQNISDVETDLINNIADQMANDIFNATVMTNKW